MLQWMPWRQSFMLELQLLQLSAHSWFTTVLLNRLQGVVVVGLLIEELWELHGHLWWWSEGLLVLYKLLLLGLHLYVSSALHVGITPLLFGWVASRLGHACCIIQVWRWVLQVGCLISIALLLRVVPTCLSGWCYGLETIVSWMEVIIYSRLVPHYGIIIVWGRACLELLMIYRDSRLMWILISHEARMHHAWSVINRQLALAWEILHGLLSHINGVWVLLIVLSAF